MAAALADLGRVALRNYGHLLSFTISPFKTWVGKF
jgi:hypothetical protein